MCTLLALVPRLFAFYLYTSCTGTMSIYHLFVHFLHWYHVCLPFICILLVLVPHLYAFYLYTSCTTYINYRHFSQFEIAFSVCTRCLCEYLFCLQVDILCCFNVQICMPELFIQIQNTIRNTIILVLAV